MQGGEIVDQVFIEIIQEILVGVILLLIGQLIDD